MTHAPIMQPTNQLFTGYLSHYPAKNRGWKKKTCVILFYLACFFSLPLTAIGQNLPTNGSITVTCNTTIYDNGGSSGDYASNALGYANILGRQNATITISGTYDTESGYDYITIRKSDGSTQTLDGTGTYSYTTPVGGSIFLEFDSDGSVEEPGFAFNISYSTPCTATPTTVNISGTSGSSTLVCGTDLILKDHNGNSNYGNNRNDYYVLNNAGGSSITISGMYWTEDNYDYVRIYAGSGIGGTLLATYDNIGSINYTGNVGQTLTIRFTSDGSQTRYGFALRASCACELSTAPTSIIGTNTICSGDATTLTTNGGSLGDGAEDVWYEGGCANEAFTQEWTSQPYSTSNTTTNSVSNGILNVSSTNGDPMINMYGLGSFNPNTYGYINVRYRVTSGTASGMEIFYTNGLYTSANANQRKYQGGVISDGQWHIVSIDMTNPNSGNWYHSNVTGWRFDWAVANGVTMDIDYITLSSLPIYAEGSSISVSPTSTTTYYTAKKGECGTTSCASQTVTVNTCAPPNISSFSPSSACVSSGATITINGSYFNGVSSVTVNGQPASITSSSSSTIQVTLPTGASGSGNIVVTTSSGSDSQGTFIVTPLPVITSNPSALKVCENGGGTFTASTSASGPTYLWEYSSSSSGPWLTTVGETGLSGQTTNVLTLSGAPISYNGIYVHCVITSSGCSTTTNSALLTVVSNPTGGSIATTSFCEGGNTTVTVAGVSNATRYAWSLPGALSGSSTTSSVGVSSSTDGSYSVSVTPQNVSGALTCPAVSPITGTVNVIATPSNPGTVTATDVSCGQLTLNWGAATHADGYEIQVSTASNFSSSIAGNNCGGMACSGSVNVGNVTSAAITGLSANTQYWIRVRARNGSAPCRSGWTNLNTTSVTTATNPVAPILTLSTTNVCIGDVVSATLQTPGSGGVGCSAVYQYSVDDGTTWLTYSLGTNITVLATYPNVRFRSAWAYCAGDCPPINNSYTCNINAPAPTISLSGVDASQCNDGIVSVTVNGGNGSFSYQWSGSNGYSSSGGTTKNGLSGGTYTVTVTDLVCGYTVTGNQFINAPWVADAGPDITTCSFPVIVNWGFAGTIPSSVSTETVYSETFESYGDVSPLPTSSTGWRQTTNTGSTWFWEIDNNCAASQGSRNLTMADGNGYECDYNWDDNGNKIAWYGTLIDATAFTNLRLKFDWKAYGENGYDYGRVVWSTDGTNWTDVSATNYMLQSNWTTVNNLDLSAADGQQFYLGFRWLNDGNTGTAPGFNIDDIKITGDFVNHASYAWTGPGGFTSSVQNPTVNLPGIYTLSTTLGSCTVTDQAIVNQPTIPAVPLVSNNGPICSGNTANLTASGMAPGGKVANLTGTQSISGTGATYNSTLNNHTIEFWANPTKTVVLNTEANTGVSGSLGGADKSLAIFPSNGGSTGNAGVGVCVGTNGVSVYEHASGHFPATLVYPTTISGWTHIAVVHQSNLSYLYINGALVHTGLSSTKNTYPSAQISGGYGYYLGGIDNVRIWNDVRTQGEIIGSMYLETPVSSAGLIGHYTFNASNGNATVGTNNGSSSATYPNADYYTYTWSGTGSPSPSTNETQTTSTLTASQNYTVTATAGGCTGTASATNSVTLHSTASITDVTASATGSLCSSATINVTAVGVVGSLNWWTGPGATGTNYGTANPLNGVPPGTYYARVTGTCGSPVEDFVSVTQLADVGTPTFTVGPANVCQNAANTTYTATASNTSGITYSVSPAGAGTINSSSGVMNWNSSFTGTATITASAAGCNGPKTADFTVTVNPNLPTSVTIDASVNTICPGTSVTLTATPTNGGSPSYQWKVNGSNAGTNSNTFTSTSFGNGDVITVVMTSTATCATGTPATSNGETITVITPTTPVASITAQPTCAAQGTIEISSPLGANYEYSLNGGTYQSSPVFPGLSAGNYSATVRLAASPSCVSSPSSSLTINSTPSPLPAMTPVFVCQNGSGTLVSNNNCINNFVIPFATNSIYYGWSASGDPTAAVPTGTNTTTCSFNGSMVRTYSVVEFQVSVTGNYIFEMNDNPAYNGVGYIYTGNFSPGSCGTGTLVRADSNSGTGNEPQLGGAGGSGAMTLTAGITYSLVSSTEGPTDVTAYDYTWTITPPLGGDIMLNQPGDVQWYTTASGGSPIYTGQNFNPVGVSGSGLINTNTAGTWTYYAACSSSPSCRTAADFTITNTTSLFNITPGGATCYDASSPVTVGLSGSLNGMVYRLYRDGAYTGSQATGTGGAITVGSTSTAGTYTVVAVIGTTCVIPMNGTVEIMPVALAEAGPTVTLCTPTPPSVVLSGTSNLTTIAQEDFGNVNDVELTNTTSDWRIHYLYGSHPANRTEWHIGNASGSNTGPAPYSMACAAGGAALGTVDHRQFQTDVPCDYAWDNGEMDEIAYKITPIDARLYTSVIVSFDFMATGNYSGGVVRDYYQVVYSLDNGVTWVAVNAGNNAGSFTLRNALNGTTNAFFSTTGATVTGTANVTMPAAVAGEYFLLGFRWTNDGNQSGDNVDNMMIDNIVVTGDTDYSWSGPGIASGGNTARPTVTAPGTYTVTVTAGNGCESTDDVVVLPRADVTNLSTSICSGSAFDGTPINGTNGTVPSGTTYSWSAPSVAGITGTASGSGATSVTGTLTNTTNSAINVVYTITPTVNGCVSPIFTVTVTVNPTPSVTTSPMTVTACSGSAFSVAPVNGTNGVIPSGTTYSWSNPTITGGLGGGTSGSSSSDISGNLTNPTTSAQTATYTVTPSIPGCTGSTFTTVVTVNPPVTLPTAISYTGVEPTCQLTSSATTDYNSSATVGTLEWSLSGITTTAGSLLPTAINSSTGVVTWPSGWSGTVTVNVRSTGCGTSGYVSRNVTIGPSIINPGFRTWTGLALDQLWQNDGNWDCGGVPTATDAVIIPETPVAGVNETPRIENGIVGNCFVIYVEGNITERIEVQTGGVLQIHQ